MEYANRYIDNTKIKKINIEVINSIITSNKILCYDIETFIPLILDLELIAQKIKIKKIDIKDNF